MPGNRFNGYTNYGVGIGLRVPHYDHIFSKKPIVDWFEIIQGLPPTWISTPRISWRSRLDCPPTSFS